MKDDWTYSKVTSLSELQKELIIKAYSLLKPGGTLVYSTCSLSYEEDDAGKEQQANQFARDFFVDATQYTEFCKKTKYTADEIRKFAKGQRVLPEFVVAMLQHDEKIEYNQFNHI